MIQCSLVRTVLDTRFAILFKSQPLSFHERIRSDIKMSFACNPKTTNSLKSFPVYPSSAAETWSGVGLYLTDDPRTPRGVEPQTETFNPPLQQLRVCLLKGFTVDGSGNAAFRECSFQLWVACFVRTHRKLFTDKKRKKKKN
ncbi:hypothetical protein JTB14_005380 [Gonioctena quinquepunctata]|nr:hypothetical protein JTB14_005380 [Gonioctena quinquepunctata]